jgi:hypothetical protein
MGNEPVDFAIPDQRAKHPFYRRCCASRVRVEVCVEGARPFFAYSFIDRTARKASCGTSTLPTCFIRFLPCFCFSQSFRLRVMSPP